MRDCQLVRKKKLSLLSLFQLYYKYCKNKIVLDELIFFVTYKCNFKCRTCFYADNMDKSIRENIKELSIDEIVKVSSSLGRFTKLLISGGEPFLRNDLPQICEVFYRQNKIRSIHLPTNGFYPERICNYTQEILDRCLGVELIISLPLDGLEKTHDEIKGVKGSFKKVTETVHAIADLKKKFTNLNIYIITVVNSKNVNEIIGLSEFIKNNLPVDIHAPSPMRGSPYDRTLLPPSYEEWVSLSGRLNIYRRYWNRRRIDSRLKLALCNNKVRYLYKVYANVLRNGKIPFKCQAGNIISVLEPNGDVRLCELTEKIGNVREVNYDFRKILFSDHADAMRKKIRNCACTHACFLEPSIKMNPLALFKSNILG